MVVIAVQPGRQQVMALLVGGERLAVGPLLPVPSRPASAPVHEVTAAIRNAGQLLDVHVPQLAGLPHRVAADPLPGRAIQPVEAVQLVPTIPARIDPSTVAG